MKQSPLGADSVCTIEYGQSVVTGLCWQLDPRTQGALNILLQAWDSWSLVAQLRSPDSDK